MIFCRLVGGLGNQLHIFSAALAMASNFDTPLYIDISLLKNEYVTKREYELEPFVKILSQNYPIHLINLNGIKDIELKEYLTSRFKKRFDIWNDNELDPKLQLEQLKANSIVRGHFINFSWADFAARVGFTHDLLHHIKLELDRFFLPDQTNVHIRLGDYLRNRNIFPKIPKKYIYQSIKLCRTSNKIFTFTDDFQSLTYKYPRMILETDRFFTSAKHKPLETLKMLSMGNSIITSNSTFSTWAAWFSKSENIFTPVPHKFGKWEDYLPDRWRRFDSVSEEWI